jgi:hypothetical protein
MCINQSSCASIWVLTTPINFSATQSSSNHFSSATMRFVALITMRILAQQPSLPLYVKGAEPFVTEVTEKRSVILY